MKPRHTLKIIAVAALGALAIFVLPALAGAKGDRHHHHESIGTITAFDAASGQLTIQLSGGESFTGVVDRRTKIRCEDQVGHGRSGASSSRSHGEPEPGDDHGGHGNEVGDDHGGQGDEPGDDHGGDNSGPGRSGHDDNGFGANCTGADLAVGAGVHEADLDLEHGHASWDEIELAG